MASKGKSERSNASRCAVSRRRRSSIAPRSETGERPTNPRGGIPPICGHTVWQPSNPKQPLAQRTVSVLRPCRDSVHFAELQDGSEAACSRCRTRRARRKGVGEPLAGLARVGVQSARLWTDCRSPQTAAPCADVGHRRPGRGRTDIRGGRSRERPARRPPSISWCRCLADVAGSLPRRARCDQA